MPDTLPEKAQILSKNKESKSEKMKIFLAI